jgi:hypothetical protein
MSDIFLLSDADLLTRMPPLVLAERAAMADVLEHLVEIDRRRLYLEQACGSLNSYCERLGYSEDAAFKRVRVARVAHSVPRVLDELRSGAIHLTGLFVLAPHLNDENADALFAEARGKSRSEIERTLARWFPKPDVPPKVVPLGKAGAGGVTGPATGPSGPSEQLGRPGTESSERPRVEPLSAARFRIEFTASAEFYAKLEKAKQLLSHALPSGDLAQLFERALDELINREVKRRMGAGKPPKSRSLRVGSRHVPLEVARQVWERDGAQCSFVDAEGRRCKERRFLTLEHDQPFALSGQPTVENISLLCSAHNAHTARRVFGEAFIAEKRALRELSNEQEAEHDLPLTDNFAKVQSALMKLGFRRQEASRVLNQLRQTQADAGLEPLLRAALRLLTPGRG